MSRILLAIALFGIVALATARPHDEANAEWTGKPWLGKWVSTDRVENWQALVDAMGLPELFGELQRAEHRFWKDGDHFHHEFANPDKNFKRNSELFHLGQEKDATVRGVPAKVRYTEDGDKLVVDIQFPSLNKHLHDVYDPRGDELFKTFRVGDVVATRWFRKANH